MLDSYTPVWFFIRLSLVRPAIAFTNTVLAIIWVHLFCSLGRLYAFRYPYVFGVLRAVPMISVVCWNVVTYRLVRIYWLFERALIFHILSTRVDASILWMRRKRVPLHGRKIFLPDYVASPSKRCTAPMFKVEECLFFCHKNEGVSYFVTLVDISRLQNVPDLSRRLFLGRP
jgi:hypothetical protein